MVHVVANGWLVGRVVTKVIMFFAHWRFTWWLRVVVFKELPVLPAGNVANGMLPPIAVVA